MRDLLPPYGEPDSTGIDPYDYDRDGLPFDVPDGYTAGDYWLREELIASREREGRRKANAWTPRRDDLEGVLIALRAELAEAEAAGTSLSTPNAFIRERVWAAAARLRYESPEGHVIEKALADTGRIEIVRFTTNDAGHPVPVYRLTTSI